jgi:MFS family permease
MNTNTSSEPLGVAAEQDPQPNYKIFVLFFLNLSFCVPTMFFPIVFPVMLRQSGAPLERVGLFGLFMIPIVLKFLWAPLVDRYGSKRFGHFKTWLISTQVVCAAVGSGMAFLRFSDQFWWIIGVGMVYVISVSTQWIAMNGLAVQCLSEAERPKGNSLATIGMAVGTIAGGSMLMLVNSLGYATTMILSQSPLILASVLLLFFKERAHPPATQKLRLLSSFEPLKSASMRRWLMLVNFCIIGDSMIIAMVRPMLVDKKLSLEEIGLMLGTVRPLFTALGAIVCSTVIVRFSRKTNLISFGLVNTVALGLFILSALNLAGTSFIYGILALAGFTSSFKWTLIYSIFMDHARKACAATDFAVQVSVISIGSALYEVLSGMLAAKMGYAPLFIFSVGLDFLGILLVAFFYRDAVKQ